MNRLLTKYSLAGLTALTLLTACDPEIDAPAASKGEADFTRYIALGNSLTSGFTNGALYREGQEVSYPNLLARQFKLVGGGEFRQPLVTPGTRGDIGFGSSGNSKFILGLSTDCKGATSLGPVPADPAGGDVTVIAGSIAAQGPFNNLGVPGAKSFHLLSPGYGDPAGLFANPITANPFYVRFAPSPNSSLLAAAVAQDPTFFTLWIGNNDVLGYGLSGGIVSGPGSDQITPQATFDGAMTALVTQLTATNAKGALVNIPDLTIIPYFNTVPAFGLAISTQTEADALKGYWASQGKDFDIKVGANPFIVRENGVVRQLAAGEKVLLSVPQNDLKCNGLGSQNPIPDKYILSNAELDSIRSAISGYNATIQSLAATHKLALADAFSFLSQLQTGITQNGTTYTPAFVSGGVFGLDGIHFSERGNAIAANVIIRAINAAYKANVPEVNVNQFTGIRFPQ